MKTYPPLFVCFWMMVAGASYSRGGVIFQDDFSGYTTGSLGGQTLARPGYAAGTWSGSGVVVGTDSLSYGTLGGDAGKRASTQAGGGEVTAGMNCSLAGPFGVLGLADGTNIGGSTSSGTLYLSFLARNASSPLEGSGADYAAFQLNRDSNQILGIGNNWNAWAYSTFGVGSDSDFIRPSDNSYLVMNGDVHLFVVKIQFAANAADTVTVWLDPDPMLGEAQLPTTRRVVLTGDASFNRLALRSGSSDGQNPWDWDRAMMGTTFGDVAYGPDTDNDGLPDGWEWLIIDSNSSDAVDGLNKVAGPANAPTVTDFDGDGISDAAEYANHTDPTKDDTDGDGLADGVETNTGLWVSASNTGTNPNLADTDGDGLDDGVETHTGVWVAAYDTGTDPLDSDTDNDGLRDGVETNTWLFIGAHNTGTSPVMADTDGDGYTDKEEIDAGSDPFVISSVPDPGDVAAVGTDDFESYGDGSIANRAGGTGFDFDNDALSNLFVGHTHTVSDWEVLFGNARITGGRLVTSESAAKREYNGPGEGSDPNSDEYIGAVKEDSAAKVVYYRVDMNREADATWGGMSSYDFGTERLFFGVPGGSGGRFGIYEPSGTTLSNVTVIPGKTYTVVAKIDYGNDLAVLWVNPDLTKSEGENTPLVTRPYTASNWSTAIRLASGGSGGATTTWDNLVVGRAWSALGVFPGVQDGDYAGWIAGYPAAGGQAGFADDPDDDGLGNGVENYLGSDPTVFTPGLRPVAATGSSLVFRHSRSNNIASDVTAAYEWSGDLVEWKSSGQANTAGTTVAIAAVTVTDNSSPLNDEIEVTATVSGSPAPHVFVRLKAARAL